MSSLLGTTKEVDMDPNKLILGWTGLMYPPKWDDRDAFNECFHCSQPFQSGHKHNCRLCGHLYCSSCTAKYYVPQEFKLKNKQGPDRVCYNCRDGCLRRKTEFYLTKGLVEPPNKKCVLIDNVYHLYPCDWVDPSTVISCNKCLSALDSHRHNCRICGDIYCGDCTTKMNIPAAFEKKAKSGPARVCHECRFKIFGKAVLESEPLTDAKLASITKTIEVKPPVVPRNTVSAPVAPAKTADSYVRLGFFGENPIASFTMAPDHTLAMVHAKLSNIITTSDYFYQVRGRPVFPEHYDIFTVKDLEDVLLVKGTIEESLNIRNAPPKFNSVINNRASPTNRMSNVPAVSSVNINPNAHNDALADAKQAINNVAEALIKKTVITSSDVSLSPVASPVAPSIRQGRSLYEFQAMDHTHLTFGANVVINILKSDNNQWWFGELNGARGWFPASYLEVIQ